MEDPVLEVELDTLEVEGVATSTGVSDYIREYRHTEDDPKMPLTKC